MPGPAWLAVLAASAAQATAPPSDDAEKIEIVVTGERVPRSLRETASSVTVITGRELEAYGADRVDQVLALIPNVQLGNGSQGPAIRGQDTTGPLVGLPAFLGGNRPRTTVVVDGRAVTYSEFVLGTFGVWDLDRIEVFRTPQTTTQGQNSIAGAIFVNTSDPTFEPEYRARAIGGDFRMLQASALASGPIVADKVALRIAGDFRYSRTTSRIDDVMAGADPNHDVYGQLRAKLLATPSPNTRMTLTYVHSRSQAPQIVGVSAPFRERRDEQAGYGILRINVDSLTAALRHEAGADLAVTALVTAGDSKAQRFAIPGFGQTRNDGRDWSAEVVADWSPAGPLRLIGGVSHGHMALRQVIDLSLLSGAIGRFRDWQDGTGIFADAQIELSSRATVTAGIRYQRDRQKREGAMAADTFTIPVDFVGRFDAWLPKLTFAYDLTPALRIGAMVQKAYNPGGTTIRFDTARADNFDAETLWDYELFARGQFASGRGTASLNMFRYEMRNAQRDERITVFTPGGRGVVFANLFNVPRARTYGAEGEVNLRLSDALSARAAVGLLGTKIVRTGLESAGLDGKEFDRSPHFSGSAAIDWTPADQLRISAQVRHHGPYFSDSGNSPALRIGSGTIANARAEYRLGRAAVFTQVRNLFDAFEMLHLSRPEFGEAEEPRTFAIGVETRL